MVVHVGGAELVEPLHVTCVQDSVELLDHLLVAHRCRCNVAASVDHAIEAVGAAELLAHNRRQRADGQSRVIAALRHLGALPPALTDAVALDIVYGLMSPELHWVLTDDRGWSHDRYEQWLTGALCSMLLAG
ncbi:MAG TPA: hypothetical protein VI296_02540 [Candidatus Dormibacteraeota bacterium]